MKYRVWRTASLILALAAPSSGLVRTKSTIATSPRTHASGGHPRRTALMASSVAAPISPSNLAVSLDRPLLSTLEYSYRAPSNRNVWSRFLGLLLNDVCKTALVGFLLALAVAVLPNLLSKLGIDATGRGGADGGNFVTRAIASIKARFTGTAGSTTEAGSTYTSPMSFTGDGGWGKATLRARSQVGSFTIYEFDLPESYYTIPLGLGQQLDFCCLSSNDDICTGSFYLFEGNVRGMGGPTSGSVRVVVANDEKEEGNAKFVSMLVRRD